MNEVSVNEVSVNEVSVNEVSVNEVLVNEVSVNEKMVYKFEDLVIWQLSRKLVRQVYTFMRDNKDYGFRDQIERAAVSVMNNIAEGFSKHKFTKDNKMFANYLTISYGSCGEVKSMLYIAEDLEYITPELCKELQDECISIARKIEALQTSLKLRERSEQPT